MPQWFLILHCSANQRRLKAQQKLGESELYLMNTWIKHMYLLHLEATEIYLWNAAYIFQKKYVCSTVTLKTPARVWVLQAVAPLFPPSSPLISPISRRQVTWVTLVQSPVDQCTKDSASISSNCLFRRQLPWEVKAPAKHPPWNCPSALWSSSRPTRKFLYRKAARMAPAFRTGRGDGDPPMPLN